MPKKLSTLTRSSAKEAPAKTSVKPTLSSGPVLNQDLQNSIPYLIARAGVRMGQSFTRELRKFDMTLTEWRVCSSLSHTPHQRLSELALNTSTEPSTLSRVVDGLMQRGLLIRERSDGDARALALCLTPEGINITQRLIPIAQLYERVSLNGFSSTQADQLRDMLKLLYDNMAPLDHAN